MQKMKMHESSRVISEKEFQRIVSPHTLFRLETVNLFLADGYAVQFFAMTDRAAFSKLAKKSGVSERARYVLRVYEKERLVDLIAPDFGRKMSKEYTWCERNSEDRIVGEPSDHSRRIRSTPLSNWSRTVWRTKTSQARITQFGSMSPPRTQT
jgi:hypothetical protein